MKNQVRIIGGKWRGRKISFPEKSRVRPTPDRVKETLFNWLAPSIVNSRCLELFAGSASLSFEALSRQASLAIAVEQDFHTVQSIKDNATLLKAENFRVEMQDCVQWLKNDKPAEPFHIAFIDPPYALKVLSLCFELINNKDWLLPNALVYFETDVPFTTLDLPGNWEILKEKKAGQVYYYLVRAL